MNKLLINGQEVEVKDAEEALVICERELASGTAYLLCKNTIRVIRALSPRGDVEVYTRKED